MAAARERAASSRWLSPSSTATGSTMTAAAAEDAGVGSTVGAASSCFHNGAWIGAIAGGIVRIWSGVRAAELASGTCSGHGGALAPHSTWLNVPLLFDLTVDVAESTALAFGTAKHRAAWEKVNATQYAMLASLKGDKISKAADHKGPKLCCNANNVVCRCEEDAL